MKENSGLVLKIGAGGAIFFGGLVGCVSGQTVGRLDITNNITDNYYTSGEHKTLHKSGASEGLDGFDREYNPLFNPSGISSKIVSKVPEELQTDYRPVDNNSVDSDLSLISETGDPITISSGNELICEIDPTNKAYDFGTKPITLWERDANDPNVYHLIANVRKEVLQNGGVVPLDNLDGTYDSEVVYWEGQVRFDTPYVHLNGDDTVNFGDYDIFISALGRTGITDANRADPNDKGAQADLDLDGDVDLGGDGCIFMDYWLTNKKFDVEKGCYVQ